MSDRTVSSIAVVAADQNGRMLDAATVASFLNVRRKRVYELVGHLALRLGKRTLRWRQTDIDRWLDDHHDDRRNVLGSGAGR
jgi:predicted DNA-binding transcriptional regulator AlpA